MTKRMLIDSTHAEETRVVVLDGNRLEDFDVETAAKQHLKGNIYLAKIVRVEPSLQAAFVEFGGGRHGFLAFGEIHPDYYQIPVADRKRLLEMQEEEARQEEEEEEREAVRSERQERAPERERGQDRGRGRGRRGRNRDASETGQENGQESGQESGEAQDTLLVAGEETAFDDAGAEEAAVDGAEFVGAEFPETGTPTHADDETAEAHEHEHEHEPAAADAVTEAGYAAAADPEAAEDFTSENTDPAPRPAAQAAAVSQDIIVAPEQVQDLFAGPGNEESGEGSHEAYGDAGAEAEAEAAEIPQDGFPDADHEDDAGAPPAPESLGGEHDTDDNGGRRSTPRFLRNYKIQEVMRRRQILLVQVVKEERGNKGAALTTYISLAGRFSVLMPNSPRGGGISRKITSAADRRRLKEVTSELDLPRGMGLIVRTAGANRPKPEILRDCEYLLNQWDEIRELTMRSMAPALIYEEANLIKRAIRDVYSRDVDDILVDGEQGWRAARDFMRMLMPTHAKKVQLWTDPQPLFAKAQVEQQLDAMLQPTVQLRSGGYLVINQTEALVAIDVNSGRSTRERGIEETALRTNLEAAEEAARQLRLRDLAGLIVIDFIDMESRRNNAAVEKKLKDALRQDRARIQLGSISHFGLLEMSRQRLRPSLAETSFVPCPHCGGTGHVRGTESAALAVLRGIEEEGAKRRAGEICVHVAGQVAFYILNHKRARLTAIEERYGMAVMFAADESLRAPEMRIERLRAPLSNEAPLPISQLPPPEPFEDPDEEMPVEADEAPEAEEAAAPAPAQAAEDTAEGDEGRKRGRRRRRGGRRDERNEAAEGAVPGEAPEAAAADDADGTESTASSDTLESAEGEPAAQDAAGEDEATPQPGAEGGERKRRGRRGGRRRRKGEAGATEGEDGAEGTESADAAAQDAAPPPPAFVPPAPRAPSYQAPSYQAPSYQAPAFAAYVGPTPADPFGGTNAFDFFDVVEQAEQARIAPARQATPVEAEPEPELELEPETVQQAEPVPQAESMPQADPASDPVIELEAQAAEATVPHDREPAAVPDAPAPAADPVSAPAVAPVVIGSDTPAEKRRGWWKR